MDLYQEMDGPNCFTNYPERNIWEEISEELQSRGFHFSSVQVENRVKTIEKKHQMKLKESHTLQLGRINQEPRIKKPLKNQVIENVFQASGNVADKTPNDIEHSQIIQEPLSDAKPKCVQEDNKCGGFVKVRDLTRVLVFLMGFSGGVIFIIIIFFSALHSVKHNDNHKLHQVEIEVSMHTHSVNETFHKGEDLIAAQLSNQVRVLCLVMTDVESYNTNGEAVKNTWGQRCNTLLFVSDFEDSSLPVVKLYAGKEKFRNWALVKSALKLIYIHYIDSHDWVLRTTDRTFVVVENLRYLLSTYKPTDPLYLGCRFKKFVKQGFMSGGAGYVLSKEAVSRMVREGLPKEICSAKDEGPEDVEMGKCMESLGVSAVDTRDSLGRGRFFPFSPEQHLIPNAIGKDSWYWDMVYYPPNSGFNCCSDSAVTFNNIGNNRMYIMNYLIYHLRPYGISSHHPLNQTNLYIVIK